MTEQTQPTDVEILDAVKHLGAAMLSPVEVARAVLAKWGTPAGAGEVVDRSVAVNLARNAIERYDCKGITTKGIHTLCTALLAMDAQLSAGRPDGTRDQKTWCSYVAGMIATYLRKDADGAEATAIAGIIERRLMFLLPTTPQPTQAQAGAVPLAAYRAYALIDSMGWALDDQEKDDMLRLLRATEAAHGIKGADHA